MSEGPERGAHYDVLIVGAGLAGLYGVYRFRESGLSVHAFEAGSGVGGTWFWNRYPGARVDVESMSYSFSFSPELEQEWDWSMFYSFQPELLDYANHVADRFGLREHITLQTRVTAARWNHAAARWDVSTDRGHTVSASQLVMAVGGLSATNVPDFPGLDSFRGRWVHTAAWPQEEVEIAGKVVGVVGTGSSGIQVIPVLAEAAEHLYVFQRTANYSLPSRNEPMDPEYMREWKRVYREHRVNALNSFNGHDIGAWPDRSAFDVSPEERLKIYEENWRLGGFTLMRTFVDLLTDAAANETLAEFVRGKIGEKVRDPIVAELLTPRDHPIGTKRICMDTNYYETFNRDNVTLIDVRRDPITEIEPDGLRTGARHYPLDVLVFATGFDALTGPLLRIDITGLDGLRLADKWHDGPTTLLGVATHGFPNLFFVTGPGSPSVLATMTTGIEQHIDWIDNLLRAMRSRGQAVVEVESTAEAAWGEQVNEVAARTLFLRTQSWYVGANIPGKPRRFLPYVGGFHVYRQHCESVAHAGYPGFVFSDGE